MGRADRCFGDRILEQTVRRPHRRCTKAGHLGRRGEKEMLGSNYLIINKKPEKFARMMLAGKTAVFLGDNGKPVDYGVLPLDDSVYAILVCSDVRLVMLVTERRENSSVYGIAWKDDADYEAGVEAIKSASGIKLSKQDLKISSYAWSIAEKLGAGVRIKVTDAIDESEMEVCPECGMLNPKGSTYCLDCGAEL